MIYLKYKETGLNTSKLELFTLLGKNSSTLSYVIYLDWLMLIFGYLGEAKIIDTITGEVVKSAFS